jgi:hypothetical protein
MKQHITEATHSSGHTLDLHTAPEATLGLKKLSEKSRDGPVSQPCKSDQCCQLSKQTWP